MKIPNTPFSTRLSGSAKETELRLRNIFQWKKKRPPVVLFVLTALVVLLCFSLFSCQVQEETPADDPIAETTSPAVSAPSTEEPVQTSPLPVEPEPEPDRDALFASYVSEFPFYTYSGMKASEEDGRTFTMEDTPKNLAEATVAGCYGLSWDGADEKLEIYRGNESLAFGPASNYKTLTIHELDTLTPEDFTVEAMPYLDSFLRELAEDVQEYGLTEYTVVYVNKTWEWTDEVLKLGPQLGNGRYERLYLVGKTAPDTGWKVYNVYWGEYIYGRILEPIELTATQEVLGYVDAIYQAGTVDLWGFLFPGTGPISVPMDDFYEEVYDLFARYEWVRAGEIPPKETGSWTFYLTGVGNTTIMLDDKRAYINVMEGSRNTYYFAENEAGELLYELIDLWDGPDLYHAMFRNLDQIDSEKELAETYVNWFREYYLSTGAVEDIRWHETTIQESSEAYLRILVRYSVKPTDPANPAWKYDTVSDDGWVDVALSISLEKLAPHQVSWYQSP